MAACGDIDGGTAASNAGIATQQQYSDADQKADREFFDAVAIRPHRRNGYTVHVVTMPPPAASPGAYFVAIVHRDDEPKEHSEHGESSPSTRYFTLEKSDAGRPVLGGCRLDGTHMNFGAGPEPVEDAFVAEIFRHVGV